MPRLPQVPGRALVGRGLGLAVSAGLHGARLAVSGGTGVAALAWGAASRLRASTAAPAPPGAPVTEPVTEGEGLPIPDFDALTPGTLRARLPRLDLDDLVRLRDHERSHADRAQVVAMLDNRIAKLKAQPRGDG